MKKILKLSLIFSVLAMILAGCSRDDGEENYPKPTATAAEITVETLSVNKDTETDSNGKVFERAIIKYKVSGKKTDDYYKYIGYIIGYLENGQKVTFLRIEYSDLKDPNGGEYTEELIIKNKYATDTGISFDFSDIKVKFFVAKI